MPDALEDVLRLVAEGRLTPAEAAPLIEALTAIPREASDRDHDGSRHHGSRRAAREARAPFGFARQGESPPRLRVRVRDHGRAVVDLQVPGILAELASSLPGIPAAYADRVREALRNGVRGSIVDVQDEDGDGVSITID